MARASRRAARAGLLLLGAAAIALGAAADAQAGTADGYASAVFGDAPVAYWRLAESSGASAVDSSRRGRDGTYLSGPTLNSSGIVNGNAAVTFDGRSQYAEVPYDSSLNTGQFSVEAWAKLSGGSGTYRSIVTSRDNGYRGYAVYAGADNTWQFWLGSGTGWFIVQGPAVALGQWTHLVGTYDGVTASLYVNGVPVASRALTYAPNLTRPLRIAAGATETTPGYYTPGTLDEVAVYATALTAAGVRFHFDAATASPPTAATGVSATAGDTQATVAWSPPASDGGTPITRYVVTTRGGGSTWTQVTAGAETSAVVRGLANGTAYTFTVSAENAAGAAPESDPSSSVTPLGPYASAIATDGPIAYWQLAERAGTTATDSSGHGRAGVYVNQPTLNVPGAVNGNAAATFDGTSQYVEVPYDASLDGAEFSVEAWVKPTGAAGTSRAIVTSRNSASAGYSLSASSANTWQFSLGTGNGSTTLTGPSVQLNQWTYLVGTYDGSTARLYVNGALFASRSIKPRYTPNAAKPLRIGAGTTETTPSALVRGTVDEVAVYPIALAADRIQSHYSTALRAASCDKYASSAGSDSGSGSQSSPFATVGKLLASLSAGQAGCLLGGTFASSNEIAVGNGGTPGAPVTLTTAPGYVAATIVAPDIWIKAGSAYVTLRNLKIVGTSAVTTLQIYGDYTTLQNLDITNNHNGRSCIAVGDYEGDHKRIVYGFALDHSKIHDCGMVAYGTHDHGLYLASTRNAQVSDNWFWQNQGGWNIQLWADAHYSHIENNVLDGGYNGNLLISGGTYTTDGPSSNNTFEQNILTWPQNRYNVESFWLYGLAGPNNVVRDSCAFGAPGSVDVYGYNGGFVASNVTVADPLYLDRSGHDYRLSTASPCAAYAATPSVGTTD